MNHCTEWADWIHGEKKIYPVDPYVSIGLTTGADDILAVRNVTAKVFRRTLATNATAVQCTYGGGFSPGHLVVVDTVRQKTRFHSDDDEEDVYHEMPPGTITLHGLDHESAEIVFESQERYLYEGMVTITAEVNGEQQIIEVGSAEAPLRWTLGGTAGPAGGEFLQSLGPGYDWDPTRRTWVQITEGLPSWVPR
ncbi:hypothetical protein Vau01_066320 [Virgisporangium aurantiacum]|uniref:Uncharacterized protein n=1 Tax=Virgisporangium aurantiacum TaxID=175570 RepID=A0A8J3Z850_9ACTN|nr:hypothetical protein Vau01_066320 [Virgisporangium aurantiacum]